jgi:hypothetical protein
MRLTRLHVGSFPYEAARRYNIIARRDMYAEKAQPNTRLCSCMCRSHNIAAQIKMMLATSIIKFYFLKKKTRKWGWLNGNGMFCHLASSTGGLCPPYARKNTSHDQSCCPSFCKKSCCSSWVFTLQGLTPHYMNQDQSRRHLPSVQAHMPSTYPYTDCHPRHRVVGIPHHRHSSNVVSLARLYRRFHPPVDIFWPSVRETRQTEV